MPIPPVLEAIFGSLPDGVCLSDAGRIAYINPAAQRLLGLRSGDGENQCICDVLCGKLSCGDKAECASDCALRDGADSRSSVTFVGRHAPPPVYQWTNADVKRMATRRDLRVRCLRLPGTGQVGQEGFHLTLIEDASAERELEARKEDWRSMVVHDLRAPLANVYGALRTLEDGARDTEAIDIAIRNCRRVMSLLDVYLDLAKLDAGKMNVNMTSVDIGACAQDAVVDLSFLSQARSIRTELKVAPGLLVRADRELLARVLQNLLHNAYKFSPEGGAVVVRTEAAEPGRVAVSVRNDGPMLTAEELPALFRRFSRGAAGRGGGSGLGLAFCREALKAMDGTIAASSGPETGTVFTILLARATI